MTATVEYAGNLRCISTHLQSGSIIETDAPTDNRGKGERFSPTDSVCMALATCMITTMGIKATDMQIELKGTRVDVTKHMLPDPRRIGKIEIVLHIPALHLNEKEMKILENTGNNCPVMKSLHPDLVVDVSYKWA